VKRTIVLSVLAVFALISGASAQIGAASSDSQKLLGTWKLVSYVGEEIPSGRRADVMGPRPSGYINYGPDGRMIVLIVGSDRKKPVGPIATQEEAQELIRSMLAYAGTYAVDSSAKTVTHHVEISWDQSRTGSSQVRTYKLDDDQLTLITQPSNDPATGEKTVRTLVWERMK
jgi:Lipocalin-like domain